MVKSLTHLTKKRKEKEKKMKTDAVTCDIVIVYI